MPTSCTLLIWNTYWAQPTNFAHSISIFVNGEIEIIH